MLIVGTPYGQLKSKITKHCTICGCSTRRQLSADVKNSPTGREEALQIIRQKAAADYTCRICKSIENDLRNN